MDADGGRRNERKVGETGSDPLSCFTAKKADPGGISLCSGIRLQLLPPSLDDHVSQRQPLGSLPARGPPAGAEAAAAPGGGVVGVGAAVLG